MSLFRRREPLRAGRAGEDGSAVTNDPEPTRPAWDASGIHGLHRVREWDVVTTVEAPTVVGDRAEFVAVSARELVVDRRP